ncbi:TonB-dependent receptor plug domain-containing protein [Leptospira ilyithenensis]|uniref:TonB-dependent receptor n=1 Tax=Leptospira ilyithenensis TaxID=2484901 RepID=A0A4R9LR55_9LEPT|nr:TonB-dependent receptor [Leptospira ilyithenensis]TGN10460.1 TonB-dependent receptor [Leptospira ilyithenensis]
MQIKNLALVSLFLCILTHSVHSQDPKVTNTSKLIQVSEFVPLESTNPNQKLATQVFETLSQELREKNYTVEKSQGSTLKDRLTKAKEENVLFLIEGFYEKQNESSSLNLYAQAYDPSTGFVVDAFNVTDEIFQTKELNINSADLLEPDSQRIRKFSKKLAQLLRSNSRKKENRENIEQYILNSKISSNNKFAITSDEKASEDAAAQVFDLLANQVTTSATKIARKTSEAPNIVSVISDKEIKDYGRISLNDILYQLPGFSPSMDYDRRTVSSRGIYEGWNNNHLMLLMDGVQFNDNLYGSAYTSEITPVSLIKSLEVIRGPGSALYGSNATNGVININTYTGKDLKGEIRTRVRAGDNGTRIYDFTTGNTGQIFSYVMTYNNYSTNGNGYQSHDGSGRTNEFGYLKKFTTNDARGNDYVFLRLDGEGALKGLSIQYHRQNWNFQTGHGWLWRIPDVKENMSESRQMASVKYTSNITDKLTQEYVLRYQEHNINWNMRFAENGAYDGFYPAGMTEYLKTGAKDILSRGQWTYILPNGGSLLGGVEGTIFKYGGDKEHYSNINVNNSVDGFPPFSADNGQRKLGSWLEWIKDKPIQKGAAFAQLTSGKVFNRLVEFTLGMRYDETVIHYRGIDQPKQDSLGNPASLFINPADPNNSPNTPYINEALGPPFIPNEKRVFRKTNPRLGIVFFPSSNLTIKAMTGTAYREPSVTELFGANTFSLASNPRKLKPEIIRTSELAIDWLAFKYLNLRANYFLTRFENQIAYSVANNNLSTNIYTLVNDGAEMEALTSYKMISGFANFSVVRRRNEHIQDSTVAKEPNQVSWVPAQTANGGINVKWEKLTSSFSIHWQGKVRRRASDLGSIDPVSGYGPFDPSTFVKNDVSTYQPIFYGSQYPVHRSKSVPEWVSINFRIGYQLMENVNFAFFISNLLNHYQPLIKNNLYPFDYINEGRRFMFDLSATF